MTPIQQIEELGYCKLEQVYSAAETAKMLSLIKEWEQKVPVLEDEYIPRLNKSCPNIYNLQNKDKYFLEMLFKSAEAEQIFIHFLNDKYYKAIPQDKPNYILRHLGARSSQEGLPLHIDSFVPSNGPVIAMQMAIFLEDSTWKNGCTIALAKSHKSGEYASDAARGFCTSLEAKKGDILIWDSRLWHGTSSNYTKETSWRIVATFTRFWIKQMFNITESLPKEIYDSLSAKQKSILGFCSVPYMDESEGIDFKRGYE